MSLTSCKRHLKTTQCQAATRSGLSFLWDKRPPSKRKPLFPLMDVLTKEKLKLQGSERLRYNMEWAGNSMKTVQITKEHGLTVNAKALEFIFS